MGSHVNRCCELIRIKRVHDDDIKLLFRGRRLAPVPREALHEPPECILDHDPHPRVVKARSRVPPLYVGSVVPLQQVLPAQVHQLPVNLHYRCLLDHVMPERLAEDGALTPANDRHSPGVGVLTRSKR